MRHSLTFVPSPPSNPCSSGAATAYGGPVASAIASVISGRAEESLHDKEQRAGDARRRRTPGGTDTGKGHEVPPDRCPEGNAREQIPRRCRTAKCRTQP